MAALLEHTRYTLKIALDASRATTALVDFSDDRRRIWRETSHPNVYRLHELGDTWADVTEGVPFSWSRERYDWSTPGTVRLTQLDSNVALPVGTIEYRLTDAHGGCMITCERHRQFLPTWRGRLAHALMTRLGARILARQLRTGFERASSSDGHTG